MPPSENLFIDYDQLATKVMQRCDLLAQCSDMVGGITRTFCTGAMAAAHVQLKTWMEDCGLQCHFDPLCNLVGSSSNDASYPRVMIGSHIDSVPNAGRYDGPLGILMGIAVVEALRETIGQLPFALSVVAFSEEEGVRFRSPYIGSRAMAGCFDTELLDRADDQGIVFRDAVRAFGGNTDQLDAARMDASSVVAFLEPHIEQGPILESEDIAVGVVHGIAGQTRLTARFIGKAGHAGTTPMHLRRDPMVAAAIWIQAIEALAKKTDGLMATVGHMLITPNVPNVIPGEVAVRLDARHIDDSIRARAVFELRAVAEKIAVERDLELIWERLEDQPAAPMDSRLNEILSHSIQDLGLQVKHMHSGAGHDAVILSRIVPTTMLFLRCRGGISHHPDESVNCADVRVALQTMVRFIQRLAATQTPTHN